MALIEGATQEKARVLLRIAGVLGLPPASIRVDHSSGGFEVPDDVADAYAQTLMPTSARRRREQGELT